MILYFKTRESIKVFFLKFVTQFINHIQTTEITVIAIQFKSVRVQLITVRTYCITKFKTVRM